MTVVTISCKKKEKKTSNFLLKRDISKFRGTEDTLTIGQQRLELDCAIKSRQKSPTISFNNHFFFCISYYFHFLKIIFNIFKMITKIRKLLGKFLFKKKLTH